MIRAKILYLLMLAGLAAFYVLYIDSFPLILMIAALLLPIFLKAGLILLHFASEGSVNCQMRTTTADEEVPVVLTIQNDTPLFFSRGEAKLRIVHAFGQEPELLKIRFPLHARNSTRLTFQIKAAYCGLVEVRLEKLYIYDLFRLFHTNIRLQHPKSTVLVLPKPVPLPIDESAPPVEQPESDRFAEKPGDDPSQVFAVREYQPGDAVSRIHWKLSSHSDKMFVKEFSSPIEKLALILVEYRPDSSQIKTAQSLLTLIYSLAYQLIQMEHPCVLVWYDGNTGSMQQFHPDSEQMLAEAFRSLYCSIQTMTGDPGTLREGLTGMTFSSATLLTNDAETRLLPFLEEQINANQKNFLPVTTAEVSVRSDIAEIHPIHPETLDPVRIIV